MKLSIAIKLLPDVAQAHALATTLTRCNEACTWLATRGTVTGITRKYDLQRMAYYELRERFGISAQIAIRCIAKVAAAFKASNNTPTFRKDSAQPYDARILRFVDASRLSLWTVAGRLTIPFVTGNQQQRLLPFRKGEAKLAHIRGKWFLLCSCEIPAKEPISSSDFLGVDLGIVNIATDSDGQVFSGEKVETARRTFAHRRRNLQRKGTRAAHRKIQRIGSRQRRFQRHENHCISKAIVAKAERTGRGIALEDLKGIRERVTARRRQRARMANWAFAQLAALAGVPVAFIDPKNTSRECSSCGHVEKANRPDRDTFCCRSCAFAGDADAIAAVNIRSRARAAVNRPEGTQVPELTIE